jgi:hypothetical protein
VPLCVIRGGEVQHDQDERTNVLHTDVLDVDVSDDSGLVVVVRLTGGRGGVGEGVSIRATVAQASSTRASTAAIGGGVATHMEAVWDTGDAAEEERAAGPLGFERSKRKKSKL